MEFLLLLRVVDLQLLFGNFNWVIGILAGQVPWLSSYFVQAYRCRGLAPYILVSFSLLRSWYDRKRYENPSSVARTTHCNAKGNILTFSLETYLIYFLKQTKFLTSSLDTIVIFEIIKQWKNELRGGGHTFYKSWIYGPYLRRSMGNICKCKQSFWTLCNLFFN